DTINFSVQSRGSRSGMDEIPAIVKVPMRSAAAGLKMTDTFRLGWIAHVEDKKSLGKPLSIGAAPAGRNALQSRDHFAVRHLNLNCPGIFRPGNKSTELWFVGVGDFEHAPAAMPKVRDIEIPAAIHFLHR